MRPPHVRINASEGRPCCSSVLYQNLCVYSYSYPFLFFFLASSRFVSYKLQTPPLSLSPSSSVCPPQNMPSKTPTTLLLLISVLNWRTSSITPFQSSPSTNECLPKTPLHTFLELSVPCPRPNHSIPTHPAPLFFDNAFQMPSKNALQHVFRTPRPLPNPS